jgi:predicted phage terminase large subunit-like protein
MGLKYDYTPEERESLLRRMYVDIFFFAKFILGDPEQPMNYHIRSKSPDFHKEIVNKLLSMEIGSKLAVVAPRGHAKSTLINLVYPLHRILFDEEKFIVLISESETQSKYFLQALGNEIEHNEKLQYFFGDRKGKTWGKEEKEFIAGFDEDGKPNSWVKVLVRGTGQKVRGLKYGAYRPTLTIIDDGEGERNTATPLLREQFRGWLNGAVIAGSNDARLIFIGTIVDEQSYLNRIAGPMSFDRKGNRKRKGWDTMFYQAIVQDTQKGLFVASGKEIVRLDGEPEVLWSDYRSYKWLSDERERLMSEGDVAYFYQEYQNIPMDDSFRVFKKEHIQYWDGSFGYNNDQPVIYLAEDGERREVPINIFFGVDPASSENVKADYTVIMVVGVDKEHNIYVIDYFRGQVTPMDGADKIFELAEVYKPKEIKIEETGHVMLSEYVTQKSKELGHFWNITPKQAIKGKYYRIKQLQPYFASKAMFIRDEHFELEQELLNFKEHGSFKKDTLDALRWAVDDMYKPNVTYDDEGSIIPFQPKMRGMDWQTGEVIYA